MTQVYWHSLTLFEFIHFKVMANIKPIDLIDMQNAVDQGRQYWIVDETKEGQRFQVSSKQLPNAIPKEENTEEELQDKTLNIDEDSLSQKVIEKIYFKKRNQQQIFDDFIDIKNNFDLCIQEVSKVIKGRGTTFKIDTLLEYLRDLNRLNQLTHCKYKLREMDHLLKNPLKVQSI